MVQRNIPQLGTAWWWQRYTDPEGRRLLTAMNNRQMRAEFCRLYNLEYPGDKDTGCPADLPPPATIVTDQGDVPLNGGLAQVNLEQLELGRAHYRPRFFPCKTSTAPTIRGSTPFPRTPFRGFC